VHGDVEYWKYPGAEGWEKCECWLNFTLGMRVPDAGLVPIVIE